MFWPLTRGNRDLEVKVNTRILTSTLVRCIYIRIYMPYLPCEWKRADHKLECSLWPGCVLYIEVKGMKTELIYLQTYNQNMRSLSVHRIPLERSRIIEKADFSYIWPYRDLDLEVKVLGPCAGHPQWKDAYVCQISDQNSQWFHRSRRSQTHRQTCYAIKNIDSIGSQSE